MYPVVIIDRWSRYVLAWKTSTTMDTTFCLEALEMALEFGKPEIFNSDQGSQFTSNAFTTMVKDNVIDIIMDCRGRCMDTIFSERLWRSQKYENVYLMHYETIPEGRKGINSYFGFYNDRRPRQALQYRTPAEVYFFKSEMRDFMAFDRVTHSQVFPARHAPRKGRGRANLAMDNPPLTRKGRINKNKKPPQSVT